MRAETNGSLRTHGIELTLLLPALLLAVCSCGAAAGPRAPRPTPSPAAAPLTTALLVTATNAPLRVLGNDGQEHLEYDLIMTNVFSNPVTLTAAKRWHSY